MQSCDEQSIITSFHRKNEFEGSSVGMKEEGRGFERERYKIKSLFCHLHHMLVIDHLHLLPKKEQILHLHHLQGSRHDEANSHPRLVRACC